MSKNKTYKLFEPISSEKLGLWSKHFQDYDQIVGYSSFGHFFLRNQNTNKYIVLHPFKVATKSYGKFNSIKEFEKKVLKEASFSEYVLRPKQVALLTKILDPLEEEEVYIPQPIPFPNGPENVESHAKANVWNFMEVVGQMYMMAITEAKNASQG